MSLGNRFVRLPLVLLAMLGAQGLAAGAQQFQLVKTGTTGAADSIRFTGVAVNKLGVTVPTAGPVINGNNLYAPDLARVGDSWHCYHGGWRDPGQPSDKIYLGISTTSNPAGPYSPASQAIINNGAYIHINDPTVVKASSNTWYMLYTAARTVGGVYRDWIDYAVSSNGVSWTPSSGDPAYEISLSDPYGFSGGTGFAKCARPSLVQTPAGWSMWFDGCDGCSYLAQATSSIPNNFTVIKRYDSLPNFPGFYEPDVHRRADGTYVAVIQRYFQDLYYATSPDGVNFTVSSTPALSVDDPMVGRIHIDNPALIYDSTTDQVLGVSYGMTDDPSLTQHDIGFSFNQYKIQAQSPDGTWHVYSNAGSPDQKNLHVFGYREFSRVQVLDPVSGALLLDQDFSSAAVGDEWQLVSIPEPNAVVLLVTGLIGLLAYARWRQKQ